MQDSRSFWVRDFLKKFLKDYSHCTSGECCCNAYSNLLQRLLVVVQRGNAASVMVLCMGQHVVEELRFTCVVLFEHFFKFECYCMLRHLIIQIDNLQKAISIRSLMHNMRSARTIEHARHRTV